jgi:hypothetical protein
MTEPPGTVVATESAPVDADHPRSTARDDQHD